MNASSTHNTRLALGSAFILTMAASAAFTYMPYLEGAPMIGHGDQANMANFARNIAEGKGAVVDSVWLHQSGGLSGNNITHPEGYWSVYLGFLIAPFFYCLGANIYALLTPALCALAVVIAATGWWVWQLTKSVTATVAAFAVVGLSAPMLAVVNGLSDVYLTAAILLSGTFLAVGLAGNKSPFLLLAGVACGLAIAFKPSGILLLGVWLPFIVIAPVKLRAIRQLALFMLAVGATLAPYASFNVKHFGTLYPPGIPLVMKAWEVMHFERIVAGRPDGWARGAYSPDRVPAGEEVAQSVKIRTYLSNLESFSGQLLVVGGIIPFWLLPFVLVGLLQLLWPPPRPQIVLADKRALIGYFALLMFVAGLFLAVRQHTEPRYWNYLLPLGVILAAPSLQLLPRAIYLVLSILAAVGGAFWAVKFKPAQLPQGYALVAKVLPPSARVMTANPWQFAFHHRMPSVVTPFTENALVLRNIAARYNVDYLVFVDNDARHDLHRKIQAGESTPRFLERAYWGEDLKVLRFKD